MKRILVAGYGNIGKALRRISQYYHLNLEFQYIDVKINCAVEAYLREEKDIGPADILVNLTGAASKDILLLCNKRGLHYIDTGVEVDNAAVGASVVGAFESFKDTELQTKALIGAGMNPGLIEVIYWMCRPDYRHWAVEMETDSARGKDDWALFNTWCPSSFYSEFCLDDTFYYDRTLVPLGRKAVQTAVQASFFPDVDSFYVVPHEEVISMAGSCKQCLLSAFLYAPPSGISKYFKTHLECEAQKTAEQIPVFHNLEGEDSVGILLYNKDDPALPLQYYYNCASHKECYEKYGVNATSWQVACGILTAIRFISELPNNKVYTMTETAELFGGEMIGFLKTLDFFISRKSFPSDPLFIKRLQEIGA